MKRLFISIKLILCTFVILTTCVFINKSWGMNMEESGSYSDEQLKELKEEILARYPNGLVKLKMVYGFHEDYDYDYAENSYDYDNPPSVIPNEIKKFDEIMKNIMDELYTRTINYFHQFEENKDYYILSILTLGEFLTRNFYNTSTCIHSSFNNFRIKFIQEHEYPKEKLDKIIGEAIWKVEKSAVELLTYPPVPEDKRRDLDFNDMATKICIDSFRSYYSSISAGSEVNLLDTEIIPMLKKCKGIKLCFHLLDLDKDNYSKTPYYPYNKNI